MTTSLLLTAPIACVATMMLAVSPAVAQNETSNPAATSGGVPGGEQQGAGSGARQQGATGAGPAQPPAAELEGSGGVDAQQPSGRLPEPKPVPLVPDRPVWNTFHGQLNAQKYSPLTQITADNVGIAQEGLGVSHGRCFGRVRTTSDLCLVGDPDLCQ